MAKVNLEVAPTSGAVSGHKGRDRWMCAILTRDVLPLLEVRIAIRIAIFFNCKTGKCDPGYDTLASELGISRRTLFRGLARLKADGWIGIHRTGSEYVQFSLFVPSLNEASAGANTVAPTAGANTVAPAEPSKQVTENEGAGDTNRGAEVPHRVAAQKNLKPEEPEGRSLTAPRTARVVRESASSNSPADDATLDEPLHRTSARLRPR